MSGCLCDRHMFKVSLHHPQYTMATSTTETEWRICDSCIHRKLDCKPPLAGTRATSCVQCQTSKIPCLVDKQPRSKNKPRKAREQKLEDMGEDEDELRVTESNDKTSLHRLKVEYTAVNEIENRYLWSTHGLAKVIDNAKHVKQQKESFIHTLDVFSAKMLRDLNEKVLRLTVSPTPRPAEVQSPSRHPHDLPNLPSDRSSAEDQRADQDGSSDEESNDSSQDKEGDAPKHPGSGDEDAGSPKSSPHPAKWGKGRSGISDGPDNGETDSENSSDSEDEEDSHPEASAHLKQSAKDVSESDDEDASGIEEDSDDD